jgi:two-component system phosphate regulon response regulator PhoB
MVEAMPQMGSKYRDRRSGKRLDATKSSGGFQFNDPDVPRIVILECDSEFEQTLARSLESEGYDARCFSDAYSDVMCLKGCLPNLVILQINQPDLRALEFVRQVRANSDFDEIKILALSKKCDEYEKIKYLTLGCDDILSAPFSICELVARVWAHLRFMRASSSSIVPALRAGTKKEKTKTDLVATGIRLDFYTRKVKRGNREVVLGNAQFHLLATFLDNPGVLFTREELAERLWENPSSNDLRTIDTLVMRLRKKICQDNEIDPIGSVRGSGYFLKQDH